MKRFLYIITFILIFCVPSHSQNNIEYYFKFIIENKSELDAITKLISIDNVRNLEVIAYANQEELDEFNKLGYKVEFLQKDIPKSLAMATTVNEMVNWDRYPTYEVYRQMLKDFESNYPSICKLDSFGTTVNGRKLYALKISDNVLNEEAEPEFFYTSTMHGDETTGFIFMLRLADSLLTSYGSATDITNLVNEVEIFINPNGNPDGTYYGGNHTVSSARRYNANGYDLNRNFPDPKEGENSSYQPETQAMMDYAEAHHFVMSGSFHGGAEVMNYPWDTWYYSQNPHADTEWFELICTDYVTTARSVYSGYMTDITSDGVTHGATWYRVAGGRQDYMNFWHQCREVTIEVSASKLLATESLNKYWNYNKQALIDYIYECLYGIRGKVANTCGEPLTAMIWVVNHDDANDSSMVFTNPDHGNYHRLIEPGTFDIIASSAECINDTIKNVVVKEGEITWLNFELTSIYDTIALNTNFKFIHDTLYFDQENTHEIIVYNDSIATLTSYGIEIENESENLWITLDKSSGNIIENKNDTVIVNINSNLLSAGFYNTNLIVTSEDCSIDIMPVEILVKDTISTKVTPPCINDSLWGGESKNYDIFVENDGLLSLNYTIEIIDYANNPWLSINKTSGSLLITEKDTLTASILTNKYGFGDFNTNIIVHKESSINDTIPVFIHVKDTISFEVSPMSINDTINQDTIVEYYITLKNTGLNSINYNAAVQIPTNNNNSWISLSNNNNTIISGNSETVLAVVNTTNVSPGSYQCLINIFESYGESYSIPFNIYVNQVQSIEIKLNSPKLKIYPNPFNDILYMDISNSSDFISIRIININGQVIQQKEINTKINSNKITLNNILNISDLNNGIYFIQVINSESQITKKIVKN